MNVESTIERMLREYGDIFPTREHAIHHLFYVIGNGYEWADGELVRDSDLDPELREADEKMSAAFAQRMEEHKKNFDAILAHLPEDMAEDIRAKQAEDARRRREAPLVLYPLNEHSHIVTVPDCVKPDWLDAACEALRLADKYKFLKGTEAESREWVRKALESLQARSVQ